MVRIARCRAVRAAPPGHRRCGASRPTGLRPWLHSAAPPGLLSGLASRLHSARPRGCLPVGLGATFGRVLSTSRSTTPLTRRLATAIDPLISRAEVAIVGQDYRTLSVRIVSMQPKFGRANVMLNEILAARGGDAGVRHVVRRAFGARSMALLVAVVVAGGGVVVVVGGGVVPPLQAESISTAATRQTVNSRLAR